MRLESLLFPISLFAAPALAVPPPPPAIPLQSNLKADNCPLAFAGSVQPYSNKGMQFSAKADDVLLLISRKPDPNLTFNLLIDDQPFILGASFNADTRIRLPRLGKYTLQISAFDPVAMQARAADFSVRLQLQDEAHQGPCERP